MSNIEQISPTHIILGLGQSGLSCARYFDRIAQSYGVLDTREYPPGREAIESSKFCQMSNFGKLDQTWLNGCKLLVVSPGISPTLPFIKKAKSLGVDVCGDVELFARNCSKPIVAITGSNGKSTVTDLTDRLINATNINCQKGGNIGLPVLDFLPQADADLYVLELSSFQLDTTFTLSPEIAVLLNISEDHMDRYSDFMAYVSSKKQIFSGANRSIYNAEDSLTFPEPIKENDIAFSLNLDSSSKKGTTNYLNRVEDGTDIIIDGSKQLKTSELSITGRHNYANVLASLSILSGLNIEINEQVLSVLKEYQGLKHRFQLVSRSKGCEWINDSKATNVGATVAALNSIEKHGRKNIVLIAGGDSKESDLQPLVEPVIEKVSHLFLLGKDRHKIADLISYSSSDIFNQVAKSNKNDIKIHFVENLKEAVVAASAIVDMNDIVLLSPACSSLDMFKNFEARGDAFIEAVRQCA